MGVCSTAGGTVAEGGRQQAGRDGAGEAAWGPAPANSSTTRLGAGAAGGAAADAGGSLQPHRRVASKRGGPDRGGRLGQGLVPGVLALFARLVLTALRGSSGATRMHVADVPAEQRQQGLLGLLELVLEGEGLDGQRGRPLILAVAHHHRGAVCGGGQTSWREKSGNKRKERNC